MATDKSKIIENAQRYAARGQIERAIEEWQKLLSVSPTDGNIYNTIGDLYLKKNLAKPAVEEYLKAADAFNEAGFALKTIAVYKKILKLTPERLDIYLKLADLNAERGLISNAIEDYLKVAKLYTKNGLIKETLEIYKKIADLDPTNLNIRLKLAEIYLKEGLKNEAAKEFLEIADVYFYKEQLKEAEEFYNQALKIDPSNSAALKGKEKISIATCKPDVNTLLSEVDSCIQAGRFNEAETIVMNLIKKDAHNPAYHQRLGYIYLGKSDLEAAFSELKPVVDEYMRGDELEKAEKIVLDYIKVDSNKVEAMILLAEIYEKSGNLDLAVSEYAQVIEYYLEKGSLAEASLANPIYQKIKELEPECREAERLRNIFEPAVAKIEEPEVVKEERAVEPEVEGTMYEEKAGLPSIEPVEGLQEEAGIITGAEKESQQYKEEIETYFTEAEVYMKYGLTNNAIEQLNAIIGLDPDNIKAHSQLKEIYRLEGKVQEAVSESITLSKIFGDLGDFASRISILNEALKLAPDNPLLKEEIRKSEIEGEVSERIQSAIDNKQEEAVASEPERAKEEPRDTIELIKDEARIEDHSAEDLAEADFYLQQGLVEDAKRLYQKILERYPNNEKAKAKLTELEVETEIEEGIKEAFTANGPETGMETRSQEELDEQIGGEEEYFDLSEVLKEDLIAEKTGESESEALDKELESIFQDFQRGVQEQFGEEDYETHYNLGIAYKEMGLINEAIGEFQLSIKGPDRFFDSASMLATCFQEKGMYKSAIVQLEKATSDPRCDEKRSISLKYDLGMLYEMANIPEAALEKMSEVYSMDINFRDVAKKVEELKTQVMAVGKENPTKSAEIKKIEKSNISKKKISYL